jgi:peptidoglycan hydrolase CwlO-like protein
MNLKLVLVVTLIAATPLVAFAQKDDPVDHVPKPSIQDAQKVVQTISNDKIKLQAYCEIGKLQEEIEKAEEKNDTRTIEALGAKIDNLEQQVGPEYVRIMDGLEQVDPNSSEGQKFAAVFNPLHEKCK